MGDTIALGAGLYLFWLCFQFIVMVLVLIAIGRTALYTKRTQEKLERTNALLADLVKEVEEARVSRIEAR